jgi:integrase
MIVLPNNCKCSELKIHPKNWNQPDADTKVEWYIYYRFYEHGRPPKQKKIKVNLFSTLAQRQKHVNQLLKQERKDLEEGYNPWLRELVEPPVTEQDEDPKKFIPKPDSKIIPSLKFAVETVASRGLNKNSIRDFKRYMDYFIEAVKYCDMASLKLSEVNPAHIRICLNACRTLAQKRKERSMGTKSPIHQTFSNHTWNVYLKNVKTCFQVLTDDRIKDYNPGTSIRKLPVLEKQREKLDVEGREVLQQKLKTVNPNFLRFLKIFFHSGGRLTELLKVKVKDVDFNKQIFKVQVLKGGLCKEESRVIKDVALPLWKEVLKNAPDPQWYVFCYRFLPGPGVLPRNVKRNAATPEMYKPMDGSQLSKKYRKLVKEGIGITADLYALKHSNSTEVKRVLGIGAAAKMNGHQSIKMMQEVYGLDEEYEMMLLKKVSNDF